MLGNQGRKQERQMGDGEGKEVARSAVTGAHIV